MALAIQPSRLTLHKRFVRGLFALLVGFSLVMSGIIVFFYLQQTDKINRTQMSDSLMHMIPRLDNNQRLWAVNAEHIYSLLIWSGIPFERESLRNFKLRSFISAQSSTMGFEGIVMVDEETGKILFHHWGSYGITDFQGAVLDEQPFWYDAHEEVLYTKIVKHMYGSGQKLSLFFFKAWDNATLKKLSFLETTSMLSVGDQPLLSSEGALALEFQPPDLRHYIKFMVDDRLYHEGREHWVDIQFLDGVKVPVYLNIRKPVLTYLPISMLWLASVGITVIFGLLLFVTFGNWLRKIGARLDELAYAASSYQNQPNEGMSDTVRRHLDLASSNKSDQIGAVGLALSDLISSAVKRDEEQRAYLQTLDLLQDAVIEFSHDGHLLRGTDAWKTMSGVNDISTCSIANCIHREDLSVFMDQISALVHRQKEQVNIRFRLRKKNDANSFFWVEGRFAPVLQNGEIRSLRGVVRDITSTYNQERQINYMALHDALTDLPNRVLMEDRMNVALSSAIRSGHRVALGFIDLDHFKQVNDNFGHNIGDIMLKEVSRRLMTIFRSTDTLSRWGGDEFVVLCPDLPSLEDVEDIVHKLSLLSNGNINIEGTEFPFTFSAGFAVYPDDASDGQTLLSQADRAMFYAKAQGRNNIQYFNKIANKGIGRQSFYIQSRLIQAVRDNNIECWLQPLICARSGKVIGAEALARWHEPEQGWISPSVFIPMAESMGLIDKVGQLVWQHALHSLTLLPEGHRLSVNLSKRQLFSGGIVQQLKDDVSMANLLPEQIMLEITESIALSEVHFARERIIELDAMGFGIAVDDFGVGYSSLSQLHEIPADELKLDISFVRRALTDNGRSMVSAIIGIAKSLKLQSVAEGIEDEETANLMRDMGVDILQGYYFAKPMSIENYVSWLSSRAGV